MDRICAGFCDAQRDRGRACAKARSARHRQFSLQRRKRIGESEERRRRHRSRPQGRRAFVVIEGIDLDKASFIAKLREFAQASKGAEIALFFYAGHGVQVVWPELSGPNRCGACERVGPQYRTDPSQHGVSSNGRWGPVQDRISRRMSQQSARRALEGGDGQPRHRCGSRIGARHSGSPGQDWLISFSTQPGNVALDGDGRNSPFRGRPGASSGEYGGPRPCLYAAERASAGDDEYAAKANSVGDTLHSECQSIWPATHNPNSVRPPRLGEGQQESFTEIEAFVKRFAGTPEGEPARAGRIQHHWGCLTLKGRQDCVRIGGAGTGRDVRMPVPSFKDCALCPEMVIMPWGHFQIGSPGDEVDRDPGEVQVQVTIPYFFAVARSLVSREEWNACVAARGCRTLQGVSTDARQGSDPVLDATPDDARSYALWLSVRTGKSYRMLSEAEWEISTRAGSATAYWWGPILDARPVIGATIRGDSVWQVPNGLRTVGTQPWLACRAMVARE